MLRQALNPPATAAAGGDRRVAGADRGPGDRGAGGAPRDLAVLASVGRDPTAAARRRDRPGRHRQTSPRPWWRRQSPDRSGSRRSTTRHRAAGSAAPDRWGVGVHRRRQRPVHLHPDPRRRAAPPGGRGPHRRTGPAPGRGRPRRWPRPQPTAPRWTPGRRQMVRTLATDRRRVQLVIAPAGAGKTTALESSPTPGPPAAATSSASPLRRRRGPARRGHRHPRRHPGPAHLGHRPPAPLPDWADRIGPRTLLLIDEAGMADTLTLDTAIGHVLDRGGRVCLVGDDQQLGAIGAGGILRRPRRRPRRGPAHPAAPLRRPRRSRRHPRRSATATPRPSTSTSTATGSDRRPRRPARPAPRRLAARPAPRSRLADAGPVPPPGRRPQPTRPSRPARRPDTAVQIELADGNQASAGDVIITRRNDRRLTSGRDWVRNGDRWTVTGLTADGGIRAIHRRTGKPVTLPAAYVRERSSSATPPPSTPPKASPPTPPTAWSTS